METVAFLQQQPLFGGVDDRAMGCILPLLRELSFVTGEVIVHEGEEGDSLFVICSGRVEILKSSDSAGSETGRRIATLGVGDVFGEMELIDMQCRSATVRALEPVSALALSNGGLFQIYESDLPTFALIVLNLARELSRRLRRLDELAARTAATGEPQTDDPRP
ncbi:MAG: cyclic nucleotide-binding domain-containing protein [Candidatus Accumulibacter sp.]|uniref:cyclic nucleotide-binding domain-containing protein n=1 Tax=Accumulibacter sp. TaxID=2053492 RepID=UPI002878EBC0|nr:cyclic nucleotide-binding domain-containing protein [Accumulibacter sp.]MDS4014769.1 cyclic nucleotide-binding domain-containing protein [Accumulibacter sp.]